MLCNILYNLKRKGTPEMKYKVGCDSSFQFLPLFAVRPAARLSRNCGVGCGVVWCGGGRGPEGGPGRPGRPLGQARRVFIENSFTSRGRPWGAGLPRGFPHLVNER